MKRRYLCLLLIAAVMAVLFGGITSCNSKKENKGPQPTEFEVSMTTQDSVAVRGLIDQFFRFVKEKDFAGATQMLYRTELNNETGEPQPLDNTEIKCVMTLLKAVPMVDYNIEYIKFSESYRNEVLCNVVIKKGNGKDMPDVTTKMFFKPMRWLGQWCLGLMNSESGDRSVVDPHKRDSVEKEYTTEMKAKSEGNKSGMSK